MRNRGREKEQNRAFKNCRRRRMREKGGLRSVSHVKSPETSKLGAELGSHMTHAWGSKFQDLGEGRPSGGLLNLKRLS